MVEESVNSNNKTKEETAPPKSVYSWNVTDVQKWFRRFCGDYYDMHASKFLAHEITGRTLIRINDNSLLRLGITDMEHREEIFRAILKLRLRTDIMEIKDLQNGNTRNMVYDRAFV